MKCFTDALPFSPALANRKEAHKQIACVGFFKSRTFSEAFGVCAVVNRWGTMRGVKGVGGTQ